MMSNIKTKIQDEIQKYREEQIRSEYRFIAEQAVENNIFNADEMNFLIDEASINIDIEEKTLQRYINAEAKRHFQKYENEDGEDAEISVFGLTEPEIPEKTFQERVETRMEQAKKDSKLWFAVQQNDIEGVKEQIACGTNINAGEAWALYLAVTNKNEEMVELLVANGAYDLSYVGSIYEKLHHNEASPYRQTGSALRAAIETGQLNCLTQIEKTLDLHNDKYQHMYEWDSGYYLNIALENGDTDIADHLIDRFGDEYLSDNAKPESMKYVESKRLHEKLTQDMSSSVFPPISKKAQELIDSLRGNSVSNVVKQEAKRRMKI